MTSREIPIVRTITSDQVKFAEGVGVFLDPPAFNPESAAPLLLSFELPREIVTSHFRIGPSERSWLPDSPDYASIVSLLYVTGAGHGPDEPDVLEEPFESASLNVYSHVVASLLSVLVGSPVAAPAASVRYSLQGQTEELRRELGAVGAQRVAGVGAVNTFLSEERTAFIELQLNELCDALFHGALDDVDDSRARKILEAVRLAHLGHVTRRFDHELGVALMVASIEACAHLAIERDDPRLADTALGYSPVELELKAFCEAGGGELGGWFKQKVRDQAKLQRKFVEYFMCHFPAADWQDVVDHPGKRADEMLHALGADPIGWRVWPEEREMLEALTEATVVELLTTAYRQRSAFLHSGAATPSPPSPVAWLIDVDYRSSGTACPTFELLATAARVTLLRWLRSDTGGG